MFICALQLSMAKYCTVKIKKSIFEFCTVWCWYLISYPYKESCLSLKMPHSGSSLISVIAFWAAMSFQIFQNVKQINLNSNWLSFNDFGLGRNVEKKFYTRIILELLISLWVPSELVCDLLDCFILLCNLIRPLPLSGCLRVRYGISELGKVHCSEMQPQPELLI